MLVALALRGEERRGSEPIVAVVESLLNDECVEVSLVMDVVDPIVAMVEVLRSAEGFSTLLDAEVEVEVEVETRMESSWCRLRRASSEERLGAWQCARSR